MIVIGIFWRYYYSRSAINYAIRDLKASKYYDRIEHIVFTPEINNLLLNIGIESKFPQYRRYGSKLGFINAKWIIEPEAPLKDPLCIEIDKDFFEEMKKMYQAKV